MSDAETWSEMWERKDDGREMFAHADLTHDVEFVRWNGHGKPDTMYSKKAGDTVLITVASRLGDVGIRGVNIDAEVHGYHARVPPEWLENLRFLSDGGRPWRKEFFQKHGEWK